MKNKLLLLFILLFQFSFAQEKLLSGKISADGNSVEGINIVNLVNEKAAVSDVNGAFQILAKPEDLLVFTAVNFEYKRKIITTDDLKQKVIEIKMTPKVGQIDEVVITQYKNINAVDLGILSKPAKVYTPAERKVRTATTGLLDPLVNLISGRTKMLKKNVQIERRILLLEKIDDLYEDEYFVEKLKIPEDKVSGFKYYAVEDSELVRAINSKNRTLSDLLFIQISQKYKAFLSDEKNKIIILTLFISYLNFAQEKLIKGKIVADGNNVEGINLMNLVNEKSTITNANGEFSILVKEDDLLIFSAENFHYKRKLIEADDLKNDLLIIQMEPKPIEIEEVVINQFAHLTAYNLGIINYIPRVYTVAERRMMSKVGTANDRKAALEIEKKLMIIEKIERLFDDEYIVQTLKIDPDYIKGFKHYFSEDKEFTKVVNSKIKNDINLAFIEIAQKYNALQKEEVVKE